MANLYTTNTARFKPFSFQEMLQPYQIYTEAYNKADEELNALLEDAATKGFNFGPQDSKEKAIYDNVIASLKDASDRLVAGDSSAFKTIKNLNKEYRKTMIPIQQKMEKRASLAEEQRKLLASNPNLRFTKDYSTESLDDITSNSTYNIIDLKAIEDHAGDLFSNEMASVIRTDLDSTPIGDTGYSYVPQGYGITTSEFDLLINNDSIVEGTGDYNSVYKSYKKQADEIDARTDINSVIKAEMKEAIKRGMRANAGKFTTDVVKTHSSREEREEFNIMSVDEQGNALATYNGAVMKGKVKPDGKGGYIPIDIENWKKIGSENKPGGGKNGSGSSGASGDKNNQIKINVSTKTDPFGKVTKDSTVTRYVTPEQLDSMEQAKLKQLEDILMGIK